jgi:Family of unknown function (DUF5762)
MSTSTSGYEKMNIQSVENNSNPTTIVITEVVQDSKVCDLDDSSFSKKKRKSSKSIPFWGINPNVLLDSSSALEFFPVESMTYEQKLNAISRTIIVLTILTFIYTQSYRLLAVSAISLLAICFLFYVHQQKKEQEGFGEDNEAAISEFLSKEGKNLGEIFSPLSSENPLGNVMIPEYEYNPTRKPAPPAYQPKVESEILKKAKQMVQEAHPDQPDIAKKLFTDLADEFEFEQSLQPFYSTANTMIPNDQGAFAQFCYGNMVSCKEGNMFACARNDMARYNMY